LLREIAFPFWYFPDYGYQAADLLWCVLRKKASLIEENYPFLIRFAAVNGKRADPPPPSQLVLLKA
jgi:hypothetical protein